MIDAPKVSVILPTYNRARLLGQAIQSVLDQTYRDFELIIVDDGSIDETEALVQAYRDSRIKYIKQKNSGISSARNRGIRMAGGRYIAFIDSDDLWLHNLLEVEVPVLETDPLIGLVYAQAQAMDRKGGPKPQRQGAGLRFPDNAFKSMLYGYVCCTPTALVRRTCFDHVGMFDETLAGRVDYDMFLRIARHYNFYFLEQVLARYRFHPGRTTGKTSPIYVQVFLTRITVIDKVFSETGLPKEILDIKPLAYRNAYLDVAMHWLGMGRFDKALTCLGKAARWSGNFFPTVLRFVYLILIYRVLSKSFLGVHLLFKAVKLFRHTMKRGQHVSEGKRETWSDRHPKLVVVSHDIRRDLVQPMRHFKRLRVVHLYCKAPYHDLTNEDLDTHLVKYTSPVDLLRLLRKERPDIVQGLEIFSVSQMRCQIIIFLYAAIRGIPQISSVHVTKPLKEKFGHLPALLLKVFLRPQVLSIRLFFFLNKGTLKNLLWMGAPEERLLPHMYGTWGVDLDAFSPDNSARAGKDTGPPVLLFVGRLHTEKGVFDLLEAYGRVRQVSKDVKLLIIGDGPQRERAAMFVSEKGWQQDVDFLGTVKNKALPRYFNRAWVFVLPSVTTRKWVECVGVANLQAMACSIPVVSTLSGGIPEYVPDGKAGFLVPENNPKALSRAILHLLSDHALRNEMGNAARDCAEARYNARHNVEKAEEVIVKLLEPV